MNPVKSLYNYARIAKVQRDTLIMIIGTNTAGVPINAKNNISVAFGGGGSGGGFDKSGIKMYFHFEESSGNLINQATSANGFDDGLGSDSDGVASGSPSYSETGKIDDAIEYAAASTTASTDYFTLGSDKDDFIFFTNDTNLTVAFWLKRSSTTTAIQATFGNGEGGGTNGFGIRFFEGDGTKFMGRIENGSANSRIITSEGFAPNNTSTWYHYILTLDKDSGGVWTFYRDNANAETYTEDLAWSAASPTNSPTVADNAGVSYIPSLTGLIDEFVVFTRIITEDERAYLYNSGDGQLI
jgi:hypothetical protein